MFQRCIEKFLTDFTKRKLIVNYVILHYLKNLLHFYVSIWYKMNFEIVDSANKRNALFEKYLKMEKY